MANGKIKGVNKVAEALGCSRSYVSEVLNGDKNDTSKLAKKIKAAHKRFRLAERNLLRELKYAKH